MRSFSSPFEPMSPTDRMAAAVPTFRFPVIAVRRSARCWSVISVECGGLAASRSATCALFIRPRWGRPAPQRRTSGSRGGQAFEEPFAPRHVPISRPRPMGFRLR